MCVIYNDCYVYNVYDNLNAWIIKKRVIVGKLVCGIIVCRGWYNKTHEFGAVIMLVIGIYRCFFLPSNVHSGCREISLSCACPIVVHTPSYFLFPTWHGFCFIWKKKKQHGWRIEVIHDTWQLLEGWVSTLASLYIAILEFMCFFLGQVSDARKWDELISGIVALLIEEDKPQ